MKNRLKTWRVVYPEELNALSRQAASLPRQRMNLNLHSLPDKVQRFFNAMEPGTYVRPHRHLDPPKIETFVLIYGAFLVLFFDDDGSIIEVVRFSREEGAAVDIAPGTWHGVICETPGTVYFEVKDGPYEAVTDKDFAGWAPEEGSDAAEEYLARLRSEAREILWRRGGGENG